VTSEGGGREREEGRDRAGKSDGKERRT